jgi:hypothetical protein
MSKRAWKLTALVMCGGVLLQLGGCAGTAAYLLAQQLISGVLSTVLAAALRSLLGLGGATDGTGGTT